VFTAVPVVVAVVVVDEEEEEVVVVVGIGLPAKAMARRARREVVGGEVGRISRRTVFLVGWVVVVDATSSWFSLFSNTDCIGIGCWWM
jgi:hypothetical protein